MTMNKKSIERLRILLLTILLFLGVVMPVNAQENTRYPVGTSYQMPDESDYQIENGEVVSGFKYGRSHMGSFFVSGNIDTETTHDRKEAYEVCDEITFGYSYDGAFQTDNKDDWNIHDTVSKIKGLDTYKVVKTGMVVIEKSSNGKDWELAATPVNDFFKNNKQGNQSLYTTPMEEIKNGMNYRVTVAYKMKKRVAQGNYAFVIPTEEYEYIECVEVYNFYVCSDVNYVTVHDLKTKKQMGINSSTSCGFYIQKNGSTGKVTVSKDNMAAVEADDFDYYSKPGKYTVEITTGLGKKWSNTIRITEGLAMTDISPVVYESKKDSGFLSDTSISGNTVFNKTSLTEISIARNEGSTLNASSYNGYSAYGVNSKSLSLYLRINTDVNDIGGGWSVISDDWGKKKKEKIDGIATGEVGKGALIIQTSKDGTTWEDVDKGRYAQGLYTTDYATYYSNNESVLIYTPSGNDILNGVYIRVLFAYQVKDSTEKDIRDYLEEYKFYLCSNELNAVTFHNLSVKAQLEQKIGEADETTVKVLKSAESMMSGACTTTGFSIDTSLNPTVTIAVKKDGNAVSMNANKQFTETGRYDVHITSAVGTSRDAVIYVDRNTDEQAIETYFGDGFISPTSKRIFTEGDYPVFEGGETTYNIKAVSDVFVPISGKITNTTTGEVIVIEGTKSEKSGTLTNAGDYIAEFTTNPGFESDEASGDARIFTYRFKVIAAGTAPGPVINQGTLNDYAHLTMADAFPVYYGLTYQSAGNGNITLAFATKEAAIQYAYEHEKGRVEKQSDGTYRYDGIYMTSQKVLYESNWDLTDAIYYFAEQAVQVLYFDMSDEFYYLTLSPDVLSANSNLKTLELQHSVVIFADGQKEQLTDLDVLPLINDKPYEYLDPETGTINRGFEGFKFVTDKFGGIDSNQVVITDGNGKTYDINYESNVGSQLEKASCLSGTVSIKETTKYGDSTSYQALYIAPQDNQTEVELTCYDGRDSEEVTVNANNVIDSLVVDSFSVKSITDQLDPYALVVIRNGQREFPFTVGQVPEMIWSEPGEYCVRCVNRMGYGFTQMITVKESDNAAIIFNGEGTDGLQSILTFNGAKDIKLPQITRYGYEFVGYTDEDKQLYSKEIENISYRGEKILDAVWKPRQITISLIDEDGTLLASIVGEFGKTYDLSVPEGKNDGHFIGWQRNGKMLSANSILIDTEEEIILTAVYEKNADTVLNDGETKTATKIPWGILVAIPVLFCGYAFFKRNKKEKANGEDI